MRAGVAVSLRIVVDFARDARGVGAVAQGVGEGRVVYLKCIQAEDQPEERRGGGGGGGGGGETGTNTGDSNTIQ